MSKKTMVSDTIERGREKTGKKLTEEQREFLLTNKDVLNKIVRGLVEDLKKL